MLSLFVASGHRSSVVAKGIDTRAKLCYNNFRTKDISFSYENKSGVSSITQQQRHIKILEYLHQNKSAQVTHLATLLGVSPVTVRKDVTYLEGRRLLMRLQGCVELNATTAVHRRMLSSYARKLRIAKRAAALIDNGDTVILESGTCCILLADELKNLKKRVTVITNSVFMAEFLAPCESITLVLLGGTYQADSMATVGPVTKACLAPFHAKYFFSGTDGYFAAEGFESDDPARAEILRDMAAHADQTVIITESQKFSSRGAMRLFSMDETDVVVTDAAIPSQAERELTAHGARVLKAQENA